ncbi:MAG TPA: hypothetical protein VFD03_06375 [Clostridia bacterium]|nr:hypothetical protein [Clostridia bacterium]
MKKINIFFITAGVLSILVINALFLFGLQKQQIKNNELIQTTVHTEVSKALPKKQIIPLKTPNNGLLVEDINFQQKLESLELSLKYLSRVTKVTPKDKHKEDQDIQRDAFVAYAAIEAQRKTDSLENVINQLNQLVESNAILLSQVNSKTVLLEESTKAVKPYYDSVSIVFRTRKTSIKGNIENQSFSNFQYGQVLSFDNSIPEYIKAFTDSKGSAITPEAAKEFLQKKSFWINSIDLINHNAIVNCTQNM